MKKDDVSIGDQSQGSNDVTSLADGHRNNRTLDVTNEVSNESLSEKNSDSPVDHGWAWIVVLGSFGVFAIAVGILKSFGVLLVELSRRYDAPASLLSSSQSLCSYLHLSVGTISNALSVRFGHRRVVFIGGVVAAIGLISTAFVRSIEWFFVTYGLITGSFGVFAITVGIMKSFGVLLVELSRRYDAPASLLSSSQSLCSYLHMSVGILSNALSARFGHRRIIFCGGILTALGLMATAFVTSIEWFFVTYGLITGFGLGLCLSPSLVFFGLFFKRNLALANGLATAGSGFGSFVFPYLMLYFLDEYSISGCMLILGAISLNICVFASLFRPLSFWNMRNQLQLSDNETINHMDSQEVTPEIRPFLNRANDAIPELNDCVLSLSDPCIHRKYGAPMRKRAATFSEDNDRNHSPPKSVVPPAMTYASIESLPIFSNKLKVMFVKH